MTTNIEDEAAIATQEALQEALEKLVDKTSLHAVLFALSGVCMSKGEHLRVNWQDPPSAFAWERMALHVDKLGERARAEKI